MALDRILEARKVVDQNQKIPNAAITPKQQEEIDHIVQESDHVQELMEDLQNDKDGRCADLERALPCTIVTKRVTQSMQ